MGAATRKINVTKDYRMFGRSDENRPLDMKAHRRLEATMKKYGFIPSFPIVCRRLADGSLIVLDGQHRLAIAESLGLPVYWTEEVIDFDVADINTAAKVWVLRDFAQKFAANGIESYQKGIEFAENNDLPLGITFALLAGTTSFGNIESKFVSGKFEIRDQAWADSVASLYGPMRGMSRDLNNSRFLQACMWVSRVPDFDRKRLLHNADRCRDKLVSYSTRDAYLDMLEEIYNFGRAKLVGLKSAAIMSMRDRSVCKKKPAELVAV